MGLKIHALPVGRIKNVAGAWVTWVRGWEEYTDLPLVMFVVIGGERPIVVDTGGPDPAVFGTRFGSGYERPPGQDPASQLARIGVEPSDVRDVILTDLHWTQCGNTSLFEGARFFVQEEELLYAVNPIELHRRMYALGTDVGPAWSGSLSHFEVIRGEREVVPGVEIVPLPGHGTGTQGVLVDTEAGRFLIAGHCVNTYGNWTGDGTFPHIPSAVFTNLVDYVDTFRRIEELNCEVIPSHDPKVLDVSVFG